jgi:hypothetical protein
MTPPSSATVALALPIGLAVEDGWPCEVDESQAH